MTAPRSTARRIPERRTSGRQEEIPAADHEPYSLQGRALRVASCSRTRRRARALDRFQVRQSSSRVQRRSSRAAAKHFSRSSSCGNAASRSCTASALSEAAYAASNGRWLGGRERFVRTMKASGLSRCSPASTANPWTSAPNANRRGRPRSAVQPNHANTPARFRQEGGGYHLNPHTPNPPAVDPPPPQRGHHDDGQQNKEQPGEVAEHALVLPRLLAKRPISAEQDGQDQGARRDELEEPVACVVGIGQVGGTLNQLRAAKKVAELDDH